MALTYGFYNSVNHDRRYYSTQFSNIVNAMITDGVFLTRGNAFAVTPAANGLGVNVDTGFAWFTNTWTENDRFLPLTLTAADVSRPRIDAIVLDVNGNDDVRENNIIVVTGAPYSTPTKPTLINEGKHTQHALAYVTVNANATSILAENIEIVVGQNETPYADAKLSGIDITALFQQWQGEFDTWFADVQSQLEGDVATNLLNKINALEQNKLDKVTDRATSEDLTLGAQDKWVSAGMLKEESLPVGSVIWSVNKPKENSKKLDGSYTNQYVLKDFIVGYETNILSTENIKGSKRCRSSFLVNDGFTLSDNVLNIFLEDNRVITINLSDYLINTHTPAPSGLPTNRTSIYTTPRYIFVAIEWDDCTGHSANGYIGNTYYMTLTYTILVYDRATLQLLSSKRKTVDNKSYTGSPTETKDYIQTDGSSMALYVTMTRKNWSTDVGATQYILLVTPSNVGLLMLTDVYPDYKKSIYMNDLLYTTMGVYELQSNSTIAGVSADNITYGTLTVLFNDVVYSIMPEGLVTVCKQTVNDKKVKREWSSITCFTTVNGTQESMVIAQENFQSCHLLIVDDELYFTIDEKKMLVPLGVNCELNLSVEYNNNALDVGQSATPNIFTDASGKFQKYTIQRGKLKNFANSCYGVF